MQKAVFLDRDGVINDGSLYYTYKPEDFYINEGVAEGLKLLQEHGFLLIVVTNQGGVAKGLYTETDVRITHVYMLELLERLGVRISSVYYCPHHSDISPCECRKPSPGMIVKAIEEWNINRSESYLIGDSDRDIKAAMAAGITPVKVSKNENILPWCRRIVEGLL